MAECQIRLHRDALSTAWGFRLQGGKDFKAPLTVQRVFVGSPAEGDLQRGDEILAIENYDARKMVHKQAMDVIRQAGGNISLRIRRSPSVRQAPPTGYPAPKQTLPPASQYRSRPTDKVTSPNQPPPMSGFQGYGQDYSPAGNVYPARQAQTKPMLDRLQLTLNHATSSPAHAYNGGEGEDEEDYHQASVHDLKKVFSQRPTRQDKPSAVKQLKSQFNQSSRPAPIQIGRPATSQTSRPATSQMSMQKPTVQQQQQHSLDRPYTYTAKPIWQKPRDTSAGPLPDPGWTPPTPTAGGAWSPVKPPQQAPFKPQVQQYAPPPPPQPINARQVMQPQNTEPSRPAWMGSLKSSGGPKPWEMREAENIAGPGAITPPAQQQPQHAQPHQPQQAAQPQQSIQPHQPRVQQMHYGPGDSAPTYSQHDGATQDNDTAQVKHLQYNSPLGLYSKQNVEAALSGQTTGKPGQGTMQVGGGGPPKNFDPQRSDVLKMLQEEEKGQRSRVSARYQEPNPHGEMNYQGYMDHSTRSPAMGRLEQHVADVGQGTSDF